VHTFRAEIQRRFSDLDLMGHVNNVVFPEYIQEARILMFREMFGGRSSGSSFVLARQEIDFRRPITLKPEPVVVETWLTKIGRSSFALGHRILDVDEVVAADAAAVMVCFDTEQQAAVALPQPLRDVLQGFLSE
jgi:acyl-CoA thioester hydrolase